MSDRRVRQTPHYAPIILILVLAAGLRWMNTGLEHLSTDGANHSLRAIGVARHGQIELLGPPMPYFNFRGWHGPVPIYLYALPFFVTYDPRLALMFTAAAHVIATSIIYAIGGRYFGRRVGVISALLFAVHPEAVHMARGIWNPMFQVPFALAYVLTGLLGYRSNNRWARLTHLPMLTLGGQCHPGMFLLAPISMVLWTTAWQRNPQQRQAQLMDTLTSGFIAVLMTIPWIIGVYIDNVNNLPQTELRVLNLISANADAQDMSTLHMLNRMYQQLGNWEYNWTQPIQPIVTIVGIILLASLTRRHKQGIALRIVALGYVLPPIMIFLLSARYEDHFIWSGYGFAFIIQGFVASRFMQNKQSPGKNRLNQNLIKWIAVITLALLTLTHILFNFRYDRGLGRMSLDKQISAINIAETLAKTTGRDLLLLVSDEVLQWEALSEGREARVVWHDRAMPLPEDGAIMLGEINYEGHPLLFSGGKILEGDFRLTELSPTKNFKPDLVPLEPISFSNSTTVFGFLRAIPESLPKAGEKWTVFMIWHLDGLRSEKYKVFTHLVDENGAKYAQVDTQSLPLAQQRVGEHAINQIDLNVGDSLPTEGPLYLHFGMYSDEDHANVIDTYGNILGTMGVIQIRSGSEPLTSWNTIQLETLVVQDQIQQGPPLKIAATWHILHTPKHDLKLNWSLVPKTNGVPYFETTTDIIKGHVATSLPANLITTEIYQLRIPTDIMPGKYILALQTISSSGDVTEIHEEPYQRIVQINPRARTFAKEPMTHTVHANFSGEITLLGYDMERDSGNIQLTLTWQSQAKMNTNYKYFVHLWRDGKIVRQIDAMPRHNQYPTAWWAVNEIVTESVNMNVADPGEYTLTTGFYNSTNGSRLRVELPHRQLDYQEWVVLGKFLVTE